MGSKEALRKQMKLKIKNQKDAERRKRSRIIHEKVFSQKEFLNSRSAMLYVSKGTGEVQTGPIIKKALMMGKKVVLPVTLVREKNINPVYLTDSKQALKKGSYGIYEPVRRKNTRPARLKDIDIVIVPGLAFDRKNNRLGRGKGYYDNFLKRLPQDTPKIGLGFRFQLFDEIPSTKRDAPLTSVITD